MVDLILPTEAETKRHSVKVSGNNTLIEAGDMGREMGKEYMRQLEKMRESHSRLKGIYYIFVYHYQQAHLPTAQYVTMCSMREESLPKNPIPGGDLWKVNNETDKMELVWTLPHRESWSQLEKNPTTDKQLKTYMEQFKQGKL